jgi:hypothetical protein
MKYFWLIDSFRDYEILYTSHEETFINTIFVRFGIICYHSQNIFHLFTAIVSLQSQSNACIMKQLLLLVYEYFIIMTNISGNNHFKYMTGIFYISNKKNLFLTHSSIKCLLQFERCNIRSTMTDDILSKVNKHWRSDK